MIPAHVEERLTEALRRTASVAVACRDAGITLRDYERLAADDEDLRDRLDHAQCDGQARRDEEILALVEEEIRKPAFEPMVSNGKLVFGWWDPAAGRWIDPDAWPGGEDALRRAAMEGAGIESKVVMRHSPLRVDD